MSGPGGQGRVLGLHIGIKSFSDQDQTQAKSQNAEFANYPSERIFASQLSIVTPRARYQLENESINVPIELLST